MARPTDEKKDSRILVRISDEMRVRLEREAKARGINVSERVRDIIKGNKIDIPGDIVDDLEVMALLEDMSLSELIIEVHRALDEERIVIRNGRVESV